MGIKAHGQMPGRVNRFVPLISGFIVGVVFTGILVWQLMPSMMLVVHQSRYDSVEETSKQLKTAIETNGWKSPAILNMNKSMAKKRSYVITGFGGVNSFWRHSKKLSYCFVDS